jgi:transcriptional regulator PpsR
MRVLNGSLPVFARRFGPCHRFRFKDFSLLTALNTPELTPSHLQRLLPAMVDMLMVLDAQSQLMEVSVFGKDLQALKPAEWAGKPLQDFISFDSQEKFKSIWDLVGKADAPVWRHLNFITPQGQDLPLQVSLLPQDKDNTVWMFCRDLSNVSQMQGRLVEAHQSMERDFLRLRHMEARYRLLFESVADPMMVVDVAQRRVMEANNAAQLLFKDLNRKLPGTDVAQLFDPSKREALDIVLRQAQTTGRMESGRVRYLKADRDCNLHVSVFVQEGGPQYLLRLQALSVLQTSQTETPVIHWFHHALDQAPVGFVVADRMGTVLASNPEFCSMVGVASHTMLVNKSLEDWLARGGVDLGVLLTNLRQSRTLRSFATDLRSMVGVLIPVDISAVTLNGDDPTYGFFFHELSNNRARDSLPVGGGMADSVAQLSQLVGRMPMKEIVGETSTMIERMCIQAALELTQNNRASAAEMLGLSRQSLYVKLHRYGMVTEGESE